ncbi:MAG: GDP-mannose 4,6-dehydratase, partial [Candidatus Hodarchaeota archaeon]
KNEGLPISIVRLFNVYGPRLDREGSGRVISRFLGQMLNNEPITVIGDGKQTRCFTYVDDVVKGIILTAEKEKAIGEIFTIGSNVEISMNYLVEILLKITGSESKITHIGLNKLYGSGYEDIQRRVPNVLKAKKLLGFSANISIEDGLRKTYDWFKRRHLDKSLPNL